MPFGLSQPRSELLGAIIVLQLVLQAFDSSNAASAMCSSRFTINFLFDQLHPFSDISDAREIRLFYTANI